MTLGDMFDTSALDSKNKKNATNDDSDEDDYDEEDDLTIDGLGDELARLFALAYARNRLTITKDKRWYISPIFSERFKLSTHDQLCKPPKKKPVAIVVAHMVFYFCLFFFKKNTFLFLFLVVSFF